MKSEAKTKTINLRAWMFLKIAPRRCCFCTTGCTPARTFTPRTYMCSRRCWPWRAGCSPIQLYYAKRRDIFDEFARENLRTTDSIA